MHMSHVPIKHISDNDADNVVHLADPTKISFAFCICSDLDWAVFEPDLLVTSSVDTYIYIWDIK